MSTLLESKADPRVTSQDGSTALIEATRSSSEQCVKLLLDAGCSSNEFDARVGGDFGDEASVGFSAD